MFRFKITFIFIYLSLLISCKNEPFTLFIGEEFVDPTAKMVVMDTMSINMSSVRMDSLVTSGTGKILAGYYEDRTVGRIVARSYFQFNIPENYSIEEDEVFDSIALILTYNDYFYGDTTQVQQYNFHRLVEDLDFEEVESFYNTTAFQYVARPSGSLVFKPRPVREEIIAARLDNSFGEELFEYMIDYDNSERTTDDFLEEFKGLVIVPSETESSSILGYGAADTTLYLKIYTHRKLLEPELKEYTLPVVNNDLQYNQITCDWNEAPMFQSAGTGIEIPSSETNDRTFVQGGLGLYSNLRFPSMPLAIEFHNTMLVKALLYLEPLEMSSWEKNTTDELRLYTVNSKGEIDGTIYSESGQEATAEFNLDEMYDEETYLVFDVTDFLYEEFADGFIESEMSLYLGFSSNVVNSTLDQVVFTADQYRSDHLKLELFFFKYDQ